MGDGTGFSKYIGNNYVCVCVCILYIVYVYYTLYRYGLNLKGSMLVIMCHVKKIYATFNLTIMCTIFLHNIFISSFQ
jgi:hypothetical protein